MKTVGDLVPASQGSEFLPKVLKVNANDGLIGAGGFISAVITSYQLYDWWNLIMWNINKNFKYN